nr:MAG TPA: hypothetical protein [Caudoviricetes sp.]
MTRSARLRILLRIRCEFLWVYYSIFGVKTQ